MLGYRSVTLYHHESTLRLMLEAGPGPISLARRRERLHQHGGVLSK